jgi:hypothetical protein
MKAEEARSVAHEVNSNKQLAQQREKSARFDALIKGIKDRADQGFRSVTILMVRVDYSSLLRLVALGYYIEDSDVGQCLVTW